MADTPGQWLPSRRIIGVSRRTLGTFEGTAAPLRVAAMSESRPGGVHLECVVSGEGIAPTIATARSTIRRLVASGCIQAKVRYRSFVRRITSSSGIAQIVSLKISTSMGPA